MHKSNKICWGQVYSPVQVVSYIIDKTIRPILKHRNIDEIRILEPACGDGHFLLPTYDLLRAKAKQSGFAPAIAARSLYGIDIDQSAVDKARQALEKHGGRSVNIACGDILDKDLILADISLGENCFDAVIGNPPYVTWEIEQQQRNYYRRNYQTAAKGKINLYRLFIERAIELLKYDGYLGFICPNTYLTDRDSHLLRQFLLKQTHIIEIVHFPESTRVFPDITQATTILIAQKSREISTTHRVKIKKISNCVELSSSEDFVHVPQQYWRNKTDGTFRVLPEWYERIAEKLDCGQKLADIAQIYQGEVNLTLHKRNLKNKYDGTNFPLLRGRHIIPYGFLPISQWHGFEPSQAVREHAMQKRLVLQQVSNMSQKLRLKCGFLQPDSPIYCANSTNYILLPGQNRTMYLFVMALCHSTIWNLLFNWASSTNHITVRELRTLPIPDCTAAARQQIADLVEQITKTDNIGLIPKIERCMDRKIFGLFGIDRDAV